MKALYEIARFQVLAAALTEGPDRKLSDAYVYAWENGVYPIFQPTGLAEAVQEHFDVNNDESSALLKVLDERWLAGDCWSFYEIEDEFDSRSGGYWERYRLIRFLRYCFLDGRFDTKFWSTLIAAGQHPSEAGYLTRPFEIISEVYLA